MSTYIKLEDVISTVNWPWRWDVTLEKLNSLPSIDPQEMIKEMIEEYEKDQWRTSRWSQNYYDLWVYIKWLRLVLDKFTSLHK